MTQSLRKAQVIINKTFKIIKKRKKNKSTKIKDQSGENVKKNIKK